MRSFLPMAILVLAVADCTEPNRRVELNARILKGSTPPASSAGAPAEKSEAAVPATSGFWAISPDQARISITSIGFIRSDGGGDSDNSLDGRCVVSYDRSAPTLTKLLDCPFIIHPGTYVGVDVSFKNSFDVLIDDAVNGIYTDPASPTKLSAARPAGGPQMVTYSVILSSGLTEFNQRAFFSQPIEVDSGATMPALSMVADMIHTVFISVSGSSRAFYVDQPRAPVELIASLGGAGRVEYYTSTGTALNVDMGSVGNTDANSVRVFYGQPPQPSYIASPVPGPSSAQNANPAKSPVAGTLGFRAGGYAGLDANGVLCWALPTTFAYDSYAHVRRMQSVSAIGASTVLRTQNLNGGQAPPPVSGDTYASGCPTFSGGDQVTVFLVAK